MQSRRIRKATLCKTLTYLERTESPLSPKVSLTTICDLCLLLRLPDRRGYFPLLCGSWLHFFCYSSIGTTEVDHSNLTTVLGLAELQKLSSVSSLPAVSETDCDFRYHHGRRLCIWDQVSSRFTRRSLSCPFTPSISQAEELLAHLLTAKLNT